MNKDEIVCIGSDLCWECQSKELYPHTPNNLLVWSNGTTKCTQCGHQGWHTRTQDEVENEDD